MSFCKCLFAFLLVLPALSCTNKKERAQEIDEWATEKALGTELPRLNDVILSLSAEHEFSSRKSKDRFRISLTGKTLLSGQVLLEIFDYRRQKIYEEHFPALALMSEEIWNMPEPSEDERSKYILERIKHFFDEDRFQKPAIGSSQAYDKSAVNKSLWRMIQADPNIIGFEYVLGQDKLKKICYVPSLKKVIVYVNCC
ncbi:MAG: hypothetical protein MI784_17205 [Cytophagales bacterium]|nr:hypothetical protein [Cytophagales bacterium]